MGIYKRPVMDWAAEVEREDRLMKEMEANGEFDNLTDDEDDCLYEMSLEDARNIVYEDPRFKQYANDTEEDMIKEGLHPFVIQHSLAMKNIYLKAVEILKKAGEI